MNDSHHPQDAAPRLQVPEESREEEFLFHFNRGGDLLQRGRDDEARFHLEQAARLFPDNAKCQNLLGLLAYRQGRLADAMDVYQKLLERHPGESSLQVNLATVLVKAGRHQMARRLLETVLNDQPGHQRARAMLEGLARLEAAGRLQAERAEQRTPDATAAWEPEPSWTDLPTPELSPQDHVATGARQAGPFSSLGSGVLVRAELFYSRLEILGMLEGAGSVEPLMKRFSGQDTRHRFGRGSRRMHLVRGYTRALLVQPPGQSLRLMALEREEGFWREEAVQAFWTEGDWENGRFQWSEQRQMHVLHLPAPAAVALAGERQWLRLQVDGTQPLRVAGELLLGWQGELEPAVVGGLASGEKNWIEFRGAGEVLVVAAPAGR